MVLTALQSKISSRACSRFRRRSRLWRRQLCGPRSAQTYAADSVDSPCVRCNPSGWSVVSWGGLEFGPTPLQSKISSDIRSRFSRQPVRSCNPGRWICCDVGRSELWWGQLCSPRSTQGGAAGSGHTCCIRCNTGGWICSCVGR